jgi:NTP pyrophosphatase (non-canonical NTP hydrolase)
MTFDEYQAKAKATALPTGDDLMYRSLGLVSEAGEVAGKIKKWIRDQDSDPAKLDKKTIIDELGDVLWYVAMLAELMDSSLAQVADNNIDKLSHRAKEGKIKGSGDNR